MKSIRIFGAAVWLAGLAYLATFVVVVCWLELVTERTAQVMGAFCGLASVMGGCFGGVALCGGSASENE